MVPDVVKLTPKVSHHTGSMRRRLTSWLHEHQTEWGALSMSQLHEHQTEQGAMFLPSLDHLL